MYGGSVIVASYLYCLYIALLKWLCYDYAFFILGFDFVYNESLD